MLTPSPAYASDSLPSKCYQYLNKDMSISSLEFYNTRDVMIEYAPNALARI